VAGPAGRAAHYPQRETAGPLGFLSTHTLRRLLSGSLSVSLAEA